MARFKTGKPPIGNRLLARLPRPDYRRLQRRLDPVRLSVGDTLYEPDEPQSHLYFPTTSVVSLVYTMKNGATGEMGIVGRDGAVGMALFMGGRTTSHRAVVQIAGGALHMSAKTLRAEFERRGRLQWLLLRYAQALLTQISQTAVCNSLHSVDQRLCRWLLLCDDRVAIGELPLTQAIIAMMLGVRREAVTAAARRLQAAKWINYSRGRIALLDRHGLESRVCECYDVVRREAERLLGIKGGIRSPQTLPVSD